MLSLTCITSFHLLYRRDIESAHCHEVEQLRKEYSHEDRELIKKFLEARRASESTLPSEDLVQELEEKPQLHGKLDIVNSHFPPFLLGSVYYSYCMY